MNCVPRVKVTSVAFSKHPGLRNSLVEQFPGAVFNEDQRRFTPSELLAFLAEADGAVIGLDQITAQVLQDLPKLRVIAKYGVGLDNIDLSAAQAMNKYVGWIGGVNRRSVSELALSFCLGLMRNVFAAGFALKHAEWIKNGGQQLTGKTVGIIGCGFIGEDLIRLLQPFNCRILINDVRDKSIVAGRYGARQVSILDLLAESDIVSLHVPCDNSTRSMINETTLGMMKRSAFLVNTARGGVVDQDALKKALALGQIAGAALDVYDVEPPSDLEFLALPTLMVTPHIGGNAQEAVEAMGAAAIQSLKSGFEAASYEGMRS